MVGLMSIGSRKYGVMTKTVASIQDNRNGSVWITKSFSTICSDTRILNDMIMQTVAVDID